MAWQGALHNLELDDDAKLDKMVGPEPTMPDYPTGMQFSLSEGDLEHAGAEDGKPGDTLRFSAMATVMNIFRTRDGCSINLEMTQFAGPDGKFFPLENPTSICLTQDELEKLDMNDDCERGDELHMIGTVRLENTSSTQYGGDMCCVQIIEMAAVENESEESRDEA